MIKFTFPLKTLSFLYRQPFYSWNKFHFSNAQSSPKVPKADKGKPTPKQEVPQNTQAATSTNGVPPFKPIEQCTIRDINIKLEDYKKELYYYYGSLSRREGPKRFNKTEFLAKRMRQMWIKSGDFSLNKHIIPVKRIRQPHESMKTLLSQGEIAAVIEGREEFPELNIVLDRTFTKHLDSKPLYKVKPFYLKLGHEEIRCTIKEKHRLLHENTPFKITFQRYIVGRPNLLNLEIKLTGRQFNPNLKELALEINQNYYNVDVWCETDEYWPLIEIDTRMITPVKPFKIIDLARMLPEGMWLHRKYDKVMYHSVSTMGDNFNYFLTNTMYPVDELKDEDGEDIDTVDLKAEALSEEMPLKKTTSKKPIAPYFRTSMRKLMQVKSEGADQKAVKALLKKGASGKKDSKNKPKSA